MHLGTYGRPDRRGLLGKRSGEMTTVFRSVRNREMELSPEIASGLKTFTESRHLASGQADGSVEVTSPGTVVSRRRAIEAATGWRRAGGR
jgi:hypothetical protein